MVMGQPGCKLGSHEGEADDREEREDGEGELSGERQRWLREYTREQGDHRRDLWHHDRHGHLQAPHTQLRTDVRQLPRPLRQDALRDAAGPISGEGDQ